MSKTNAGPYYLNTTAELSTTYNSSYQAKNAIDGYATQPGYLPAWSQFEIEPYLRIKLRSVRDIWYVSIKYLRHEVSGSYSLKVTYSLTLSEYYILYEESGKTKTPLSTTFFNVAAPMKAKYFILTYKSDQGHQVQLSIKEIRLFYYLDMP